MYHALAGTGTVLEVVLRFVTRFPRKTQLGVDNEAK